MQRRREKPLLTCSGKSSLSSLSASLSSSSYGETKKDIIVHTVHSIEKWQEQRDNRCMKAIGLQLTG